MPHLLKAYERHNKKNEKKLCFQNKPHYFKNISRVNLLKQEINLIELMNRENTFLTTKIKKKKNEMQMNITIYKICFLSIFIKKFSIEKKKVQFLMNTNIIYTLYVHSYYISL